MTKYLLAFLLSYSLIGVLHAQELKVDITVNTPRIQLVDPAVFATLKTSIQEFMNNQRWTDEVFDLDERIEVTIQLTINNEFSQNSFGAEMSIQAARPVYGSNFKTSILMHVDKDITFTYDQFQPIVYSRTAYVDNLSSILSFYAYIILGYDADTFAKNGGEPYFLIAQDIVNMIPTQGSQKGWRPQDGQRARYWILENALNPNFRPMREAAYLYHIKGLDEMHRDANKGKVNIVKALDDIAQIAKIHRNSMAVQLFANAKNTEIVEVFKVADIPMKRQVQDLMGLIDPANSSRYRQIGL
jgi:hypothetical protein